MSGEIRVSALTEVRHKQVRKEEGIFFVCPACGVSFEVRSETSTRIFCSPNCRGYGGTQQASEWRVWNRSPAPFFAQPRKDSE